VFDEPKELSWRGFREGLGDNKHAAMDIGAAFIFFWYLCILFFTSFFSYKEGFFWQAFKAYDIWTKTGTKEHSQNGTWAYLKWGSKGENVIILGSIIGSLVAMIKNKHRFATFCAAWAAGVFAAYMIIPYKTPWCALNYVLPMCLIAGYGLNELILSKNRRLNIIAYVFIVVGSILLGYQTYKSNWLRYDDDQQPYVYAHTRRGFVDMMNQIDYYKDKSGKGYDTVIDLTSPDYWPMTWYVVDYNHVGYHGRVIDTNAEIVITKKKDQDAEMIPKYQDKYKYVGMYPLRPGVDLNLLVRNDIADPPCTGPVTDGEQKGGGVVLYNTNHCTRDLSVIPSIPMTP
jgi:predicted membrane-bound mannosyltransferase